MKLINTVLLAAILLLNLNACNMNKVTSRPENASMGAKNDSESMFYNFKMKSLDGSEDIDFSRYKAKKVLIVNVASKCGLTPQYKGLQELHEKHGDKIVILGFPANNFMGQEPGSNEEIATFCEKNYGVEFQMFEKISVIGDDQHPLYQWLTDKSQNGWNEQEPTWNFSKYLINEKGELEKFFGPKVQPMSEEVLKAIKG